MIKKNFRYLYFYLLIIFNNLFSEKNLIEILEKYNYINEDNDNSNDKYKNKKKELEDFINKLDNNEKLKIKKEIKEYIDSKNIILNDNYENNTTLLSYVIYFEKEKIKNISNNKYFFYDDELYKYIIKKSTDEDLGKIFKIDGILQGKLKGVFRNFIYIYYNFIEKISNFPEKLGNSLRGSINSLSEDKEFNNKTNIFIKNILNSILNNNEIRKNGSKFLSNLLNDKDLKNDLDEFLNKCLIDLLNNNEIRKEGSNFLISLLNDKDLKKDLDEFLNKCLIDLLNNNEIRKEGINFLISLLNDKDFKEEGVIFLSNLLKDKELKNEANIFIKELCSNTLDDPKMKKNVDKFFNERMNNLSLNLNIILNKFLYFCIGGLLSLKSIYWFMQNFSNLLLLKNKFKKDEVKKNKKVMVCREIENRNKKLKLDFILNTFAACIGLFIIKENIKNNTFINN